MTDERIDPKAIDAAEDVSVDLIRKAGAPLLTARLHREMLEAAIRVADRERGLKEERMNGPEGEEARLVSDWRQVERGGEDG